MRFYFIRHGQSANNALWDATGNNAGRAVDPELTETGHKQAQHLAQFLHQKNSEEAGSDTRFNRDSFRFTHLYTSLMVRSVATGSYVSRAIGLPLVAWPEVHECGGIYEDGEEDTRTGLPGYPRSYFEKHYAHLVLPDTLTEAGWWNRPFEEHDLRPLRAQRVLEALLERHGGTNDRVAIISHGGFYMEFMRVLFGIKNHEGWFTMFNTAISRIDFRSTGETALIYHNRTDHLPEKLIT